MKIKIAPFSGHHCETTATGTLLRCLDIKLSEPMLFGLGEGLSFIFWNMKQLPFPFIGGRVKPDALTRSIASNLGLELTVKETSSKKKAWDEVNRLLEEGQVVGLKLDCFHLEYFSNPIHFAGHYVAIYGHDGSDAFLVDTKPQGGRVTTSLESLAAARAEKGAMSSRNLYYTIEATGKVANIEQAVRTAVRNNAKAYLNPPIRNVSYKGIHKTSTEIVKWFNRTTDIEGDFATTAMLMEHAGTGGALFRNLYRDFLKEAGQLTDSKIFKEGHRNFMEIAQSWSTVIHEIELTAKTKDVQHILNAAEELKRLSSLEHDAMAKLAMI